ncbi:ATP-dependent helicase [Anaerovorax sp. IOR16]|uniref:ATP-dependent helicase n=1 Tax=Anaerovorax sp. IOR16 TaxID=2773458 RepID=UPI0019CF85EE|nr:ATP-dependent helicase [Anaerovorax sp. IOR16]
MDLSVAKKLKDSDERINISNHFKIVAGPGAGKTRFLINHINHIIEKSDKISDIRKIACITYTNVGVETIIFRLGKSIDYVDVTTIHSFLYLNIVKPYLWVLEDDYKFDFINIDGHDDIVPTFSIMNEWKLRTRQYALNDNNKLAKELSKLHWYLDDGELILRFKEIWEGKVGAYNIKKDSYLEYKKICWEKGLLSHDDVLFLSIKIIEKSPRILEIIRGKFPYVLVDEFQDTNPIQTKVLKLIAEKETIVGVIGDECQSIYKFQGADVTQFTEFDLPELKTYYIEDNHRSTQEIIDILNYMRNDKNFHQESPENKHGHKPTILIGGFIDSYNEAIKLCNKDELYTLSFKNELCNMIQYGIDNYFSENIFDEFIFSDGDRGKMIFYIIHSLEYCRQDKFKDAIKYMKKAYRKIKDFDDKAALENLKRLYNLYSRIQQINIKELYNNYIFGFYGVKAKVTSGKANNYYKNLTYNKVACVITITDDDGKFRTIHKAKGDEFKNVLLLLEPKEQYNEETELSFLLNPDMGNESHRVYYVALSRAMENLYISIPQLSDENRSKLNNFEIMEVRPKS